MTDRARDLWPQQVDLLVQPLESERAQGWIWLGEVAHHTGGRCKADHCVVLGRNKTGVNVGEWPSAILKREGAVAEVGGRRWSCAVAPAGLACGQRMRWGRVAWGIYRRGRSERETKM